LRMPVARARLIPGRRLDFLRDFDGRHFSAHLTRRDQNASAVLHVVDRRASPTTLGPNVT
jgi:hypothetical protein